MSTRSEVSEICSTPAAVLVRRIRSREVSPLEVVEAVLSRVDALEPTLHAFCTRTDESALADAKRLEQDLAAGRPVGALAGVPIGIKDLVPTKGVRTTGGSVAYGDWEPEEDEVVVERLKTAGAVMIGKTNAPEFGYSAVGHNPIFETTRNPWDPALTPGGSSAGSGAAVASGMGPFAIGTDGGGSIRIPSAFCGLVGVKPSMGRVPLYPGCRDERYPGFSGWESLEHIGPISRTVEDAALMLSVIAGPDDRDRHSLPIEAGFDWLSAVQGDLRGLRVAYSSDWGYAAVEPAIRRVVGEAVAVFERELRCEVEEVNPGWEDPFVAFSGLMAMETDLKGMRRMVAEYGHSMTPSLVDFISRPWTAEELTDANMARKAVNNKMWQLMRNYDLLLTPTTAVPPFPILMQGPEKIAHHIVQPSQWICFTFPINMTGQPAASVPAGWTEDGLPVGLQIVGRHLADSTVLLSAAAYEAARPWAHRWPPLLEDLQP